MQRSPQSPVGRFFAELMTIGFRFRQVLRLTPVGPRRRLGAALAVMTLASVCAVGVPLLIGRLVETVRLGLERDPSVGDPVGAIALVIAAIAGVILVREGLNVLRRFLAEGACASVDEQLGVRVVSHVMRADLSTLTHEKLGALHGRIFRSVDGAVRYLKLGFLDFIPALITGGLALSLVFSKQPLIGMLMLGIIPLSIALTAWQLASQKDVRMGLIRARESMDATVVEQLGGLDYVRVAHTHDREVARFAAAARVRRDGEFRHHVVMSFFGCGKGLAEGAFHLGVLGLAAYFAITSGGTALSYGDIFTISALFLSVMTPLSEIHRVIDVGHEAGMHVGNLVEILDQPPDRSFAAATRELPPEVANDPGTPAVRVHDLVVEHTGSDGKPHRVLNGLSLDIRKGETVGVAGRSGCGKTTLLKVLMRLIHPQTGTAELNGVPICAVSREMVAAQIGYVGQQPFVFAGTIAENIAYGTGVTDPDAIRRAARQACLHDEIMRMPGGFDAPVAEKGQNLSGGQKQRIALARVFLKDPPILILDEATSALDTISERCVQEAIDAARHDRTVIVVAHRLSTFADADRILVLDEGRVVESGTFTELVKQGGAFAALVMSADMTETGVQTVRPRRVRRTQRLEALAEAT